MTIFLRSFLLGVLAIYPALSYNRQRVPGRTVSMLPSKDRFIRKIADNFQFLKFAIEEEGLGLLYLQYLQSGGASIEPKEKKIVLENMARKLITEDEHYVALIADIFSFDDLIRIKERIIGQGRIGGKSTGMLLAHNALKKNEDYLGCEIRIPRSWYIGSVVFTEFLEQNGLERFENVKWQESIHEENYQELLSLFPEATFGQDIIARIKKLLKKTQGTPLIVRSSSLLEDCRKAPFAGLYDSYFIPNCFSLDENLEMFVEGMKTIYASLFKPDCFEYRRKRGLLRQYEAMAFLVQEVVGMELEGMEKHEDLYAPLFSGVGFSQNCFPWSKDVRQEDGAVRLAFGLGTAVVDRPEEDGGTFLCDLTTYSHPKGEQMLKSSQRQVHVVDMKERDFRETVKPIDVNELIRGNLRSYFEDNDLLGAEELISVSDRTGRIRRANKHTMKKGYPFVTFHSIAQKWGPQLKKMLKVIEFVYTREEIAAYLNDAMWIKVGKIIGYCPPNIRECLKEDKITIFCECSIKSEFQHDQKFARGLADQLRFVVEAKNLIKRLGDYRSFKYAFNQVMHKELKNDINKLLRRKAVDVEFAVVGEVLYLLQCRSLSLYSDADLDKDLASILEWDKFIEVRSICPTAQVHIDSVLYVDGERYADMTEPEKFEIRDTIGEINLDIGAENEERQKDGRESRNVMFLLPGRVGSSHPELGVPVRYHDVDNARILVECPMGDQQPDFSYGSHFYLRLVGDEIYTFPIASGDLFRKELIDSNQVEHYLGGAIVIADIPQTIYMSGVEKWIVSELETEQEK